MPLYKHATVNVSSEDCRLTPGGHEYKGTLSVTESGRQCQPWASNTPHVVNSKYIGDKYPDGSREAACNYCRNPALGWTGGLWCYTMDPNKQFDLCDVPMCGKCSTDCTPCCVSKNLCQLISCFPSIKYEPISLKVGRVAQRKKPLTKLLLKYPLHLKYVLALP